MVHDIARKEWKLIIILFCMELELFHNEMYLVFGWLNIYQFNCECSWLYHVNKLEFHRH